MNINDKIKELAKIGDLPSLQEIVTLAETNLSSRSFAIQEMAGVRNEFAVVGICMLGKQSQEHAAMAVEIIRRNLKNGMYADIKHLTTSGSMMEIAKLYPECTVAAFEVLEEIGGWMAVNSVFSIVSVNSDYIQDAANILERLYRNADEDTAIIDTLFSLMRAREKCVMPGLSGLIMLRENFSKAADKQQVRFFDRKISEVVKDLAQPLLISPHISEKDTMVLYHVIEHAKAVVSGMAQPRPN